MSQQPSEQVSLNNDEELVRKALAYPTIRATVDEEYMKFRVIKEEAVIPTKGLFPNSWTIRLTAAPLDENDETVSSLTVRYDITLPLMNPESPGHEAPKTLRDCIRYFSATNPEKFPAPPTWNKFTKKYMTATGEIVSTQAAKAAEEKTGLAVIKALRELWVAMYDNKQEGGFVDDVFFAKVKAGGSGENAGKYRNVYGIVGEVPANGTVVTEGFKSQMD